MDAEARTPAPGPKIIKRYANRKLYDTVESRYVTLEEIGEMIKQGTEVQIVDREILAGDRYGHAHPSEFTQTQLQAVQQTLSNTKRARRPQRRAHQNRTPLGG